MDFSSKNGLAFLAIGLACARTCEQLLHLYHSHRSAPAAAASPRASVLSPVAGLAALAYAHTIGADSALLIATWLHTATASVTVMIAPLNFQRGHKEAAMTSREINHD